MMMLNRLCEKYTDLLEEDILIIQELSTFLPLISRVTDGDVFIDCKTKDPNTAIVVAEFRKEKSLYKEIVVGKFALRENEPAALRTLDTGNSTSQLNGVSQENIPIEQSTTAIKNKDKIIGVLIVEKDITRDFIEKHNINILNNAEISKDESNIKVKDKYTHDIGEYSVDGILIFDERGHLTYCNPVAKLIYKKLGYRDELIGMNFRNLVLESIKFKDILARKYIETQELVIGEFCFSAKYSLLSSGAEVVVLIRDLTELKKQRQELVSRSVAIREIHHRVKNNLQTIASLLRMQSRRTKDEAVKSAFAESINRILSIAVTHEILAQNGVGTIDIKEMITSLIENTIYYNSKPNMDIVVEVLGDTFEVDSQKATAIALIVNELLQNSFEHAFRGKNWGKVELKIESDFLYSQITVKDNGVGFDVNGIKESSFGINIVRGLVRETLGGEVSIDADNNGTNVVFSFLTNQ